MSLQENIYYRWLVVEGALFRIRQWKAAYFHVQATTIAAEQVAASTTVLELQLEQPVSLLDHKMNVQKCRQTHDYK